MITETERNHILKCLEDAKELEGTLLMGKKPYIKEYRIVSRINRRLAVVRKYKRELESKLLVNTVDNFLTDKTE